MAVLILKAEKETETQQNNKKFQYITDEDFNITYLLQI